MNKPLLLLIPALLLVSCDSPDAPQAFTPEMASFSNEFDFDPLRGPVKDFSQTLINEKGEVVKRVTGTLSKEGCFESLEFHDLDANTGASLVLNANYYLDAISQEKRIKLQGKCQLAELAGAEVRYDTDDNGFVVAAKGKEATTQYRYDAEGYPLGKSIEAKALHFTVDTNTSADKRKKLDYSALSTLNDKPVSRAQQQCDYDRHFNPLSCKLSISDEQGTQPTVQKFTIKNTIDYY